MDTSRSSTLRRRSFLQLALGATAVALGSACAPAPPAASPGTPTSAPAKPAAEAPTPAVAAAKPTVASTASAGAAGQPRSGGTLRSAITQDITALDGHLSMSQNRNTVWQVFDRLITYDDNLEPQPALAETWDVSSDYTKVKLNLRKGVQWHTGRELTSDDVKWNILRVRDPKAGAGQLATQSAWFSGIETPDKNTVVLTSEKPRPGIYDFFEFFNIVDPVTMEGPNAKSTMVGTGPFKFTEFQQGSVFRLVKNPNYWQSGRPYLDEVVMQIMADQQTVAAQLEAGALDFADPGIRDALRLTKDGKFAFVENPNWADGTVINLNTTLPPTDDKRVRQGMQYAVDRKRFVDTVQLGQGRAMSLPWPPRSPAYEEARANFYPFDLDKAKALFAQAGLTDAELEFNYQAPVTANAQLGQIIQSDLAKIGIKLTLKPLEPAAWRAAAEGLKYHGLNATSNGFTQLGEASSMFSIGRSWAPPANNAGYKSDAYAQLVESAASEPDAAKRKQVYTKLNDFILDESIGVVVAAAPNSYIYRANMRGVGYWVSAGLRLAETWLAA